MEFLEREGDRLSAVGADVTFSPCPKPEPKAKSLPCILAKGCNALCEPPIDNVHIVTGGVGRKADYRFIVPACRKVHRILHTIGRATFERRYSVSLDQLAADTEAAWQKSLAAEAPR